MNALTTHVCVYTFTDEVDYEKIAVTDKGLVFKRSHDELVWVEVEGACDALIDGALAPQDDPRHEPRGRSHRAPQHGSAWATGRPTSRGADGASRPSPPNSTGHGQRRHMI